MKKRILSAALALLLVLALVPAGAAAEPYTDVPDDSWAAAEIRSATACGLMDGMGDGLFGYGLQVTRAQFATLVCRMLGWEPAAVQASSFSDVAADGWAAPYIETALANDAFDPADCFRPEDAITREEMAVMLVRGLGYKSLAAQVEGFGSPFSDVSANAGAIAIARDIGMVRGAGEGLFLPHSTARREEAAAMLVRVYARLQSGTDWLHGFYAHASYGQRHLAAEMDAVSFGWSALEWDGETARLNTSSAGGNEWAIPSGYNLITDQLAAAGTKMHLSVYMDSAGPGNPLRELLDSARGRAQAVEAIVAEATRAYELTGGSPYSGVTIDFEGLTAPDRDNLTAFLQELAGPLRARGMALYVAVHAALPDSGYYNGYDYRAIGDLADRVILMAHDYSPARLDSYVGTRWQENTPVTPFSQVYYALRAVTDGETGVADPAKVALALSFSPVAWEVDAEGLLASGAPLYPTAERVAQRMRQGDTVLAYSPLYRNPYMTYTTEQGDRIFLWYEDARSVADKLALARLFGITGVSVWRLGLIPEAEGYSVWQALR